MTAASTLRTDLESAIAECAENIVNDFRRQGLAPEVAIAVAATVVRNLINDLPTEHRVPFLRAYAASLTATPRLDA